MQLSESEILQILKMVEESNFGELRLETGELKLVVRKNGYNPGAEADPPPTDSGPGPLQVQQVLQHTPAQPDDRPKKTAADQEGVVAIKSPMLGTVYRRSSPDAPPYVEVGSFVKEDDTICLIEVMKVFTAVKAGVRGYITQVLIETNEMIEYNQPLFLVRLATEPQKTDG